MILNLSNTPSPPIDHSPTRPPVRLSGWFLSVAPSAISDIVVAFVVTVIATIALGASPPLLRISRPADPSERRARTYWPL